MHERYRTPQMDAIWGERARNRVEREIWTEVMYQQQQMGVPIPGEAIADYLLATEAIADCDDELEEIAKIEAETGHDLYARLLYFNRCAGHEWAHLGLTSADIVENAQQRQVARSIALIMDHGGQLVTRLCNLAQREAYGPTVGRTHGRPAQITTIGKRITDWVTELVVALHMLEMAGDYYLSRGIKGAVGTRADMAALLYRHDPHADAHRLAEQLDLAVGGIPDPDDSYARLLLPTCGQTYPRGMDLPWASAMLQVAAACDTICTNVRLWAVLGHANERRDPGQVGSSAMPHKSNPRHSERVRSLTVAARGYHSMLAELAGAQWFEGDVSSSAARRIALPGLCHTVDAVLANTAHVLGRLEFDHAAIAQDVRLHLPQLASGLVLEACVAAGADRSRAHQRISEASRLHDPGRTSEWLAHLADDPDLPLDATQLAELVNVQRLVEPARRVAEEAVLALLPDLAELDTAWPGELL